MTLHRIYKQGSSPVLTLRRNELAWLNATLSDYVHCEQVAPGMLLILGPRLTVQDLDLISAALNRVILSDHQP